MGVTGQSNVSQTARLMIDAPSYAIGWQELILVPNPAAGATWTHTVDGRYYERLVAANFTLTTSATVANRFITLVATDNNGAVVTEVPGSGAVVAGSVLTANLVDGAPAFAAAISGSSFGFLPDVLMAPGWVWAASINGIQAADTVTAITLLVQRFPNDIATIEAGA